MKIGVLIDRLNVGGVEKSAIQEVKALRELGKDATLLVLSRKPVVEGAHQDLLGQVPVEYLDDRLPKFLRFTFTFPGFAFFSLFHITYPLLLPFVLKDREYDHIISHGSYTTLSAMGIKFLRGIPYSIYFWDPTNYIIKRVYTGKFPRSLLGVFAFFGRLIDRLLVISSDHVFVAGDTHNTYLHQYVKPEKITVVNPGTPLGEPLTDKDERVYMVTTWKEGKHPEYVFELLEVLPELRIVMVGGWIGDSLRESFEKEMNERNLSDRIELWGEANEAQLKELYPKALVQLTTNLEKGFGMPVLEAAACGTVSIVPLGSGVCQVFEHEKDIFYSGERDTKEISGYLKKLLDNPDLAKEMGMKAFNRVKGSHTWKAHSQKILDEIQPKDGE
jgi:glycosyltransferase involved in cell wall biosynthesis